MIHSWRDKKYIPITNAFRWIKPEIKQICVDKGSKYYNRSMKSLLQDKDIVMLSMDKE